MTVQVVDSENVIDSIESAPDKLRAEIGSYYRSREINSPLIPINFSTGRL